MSATHTVQITIANKPNITNTISLVLQSQTSYYNILKTSCAMFFIAKKVSNLQHELSKSGFLVLLKDKVSHGTHQLLLLLLLKMKRLE